MSVLLSTDFVTFLHSRPQSPRSFWPVAGIESSGLVQHRKSAIHGLPVKSGKSDWLIIRNEYSAHTQKIGSGQSSRSLPQARRIVGSGDENDIFIDVHCENLLLYQDYLKSNKYQHPWGWKGLNKANKCIVPACFCVFVI